MKHLYLTVLLSLCGCLITWGQPSNTPGLQAATGAEAIETAVRQLSSTCTPFRANENAEQDPKTLTNLPADAEVFHQNLNPVFPGDCVTHASIMSADLVEYFIGNTITKVQTIVPKGSTKVKLWIADADNLGTPLYSKYVTCERDKVVELPCNLKIEKAFNLLVAITMEYNEKSDCWAPIVPCNRYSAWFLEDTSTGIAGFLDYTNMRAQLYGDENLCYGYFFNCITEGEGGFRDYEIKVEGVSHTRAFIGEASDFSIGVTNYGTKKIATAKFLAKMGDAEQVIEHEQAIKFLYYANIKSQLSTPTTPVRVPLSVELIEVGGESISDSNCSEDGSITAVDPKLSVRRNTVMEEFTGTWCGWCPRGARAIELLMEKYPDTFIPIAIHGNDEFSVSEFDTHIARYSKGFPSSTVNRLTFGDPYTGSTEHGGGNLGIAKDLAYVSKLPCEATLTLKDAILDADAREITFTTDVCFSIDSKTAPYAYGFVLTEDGLSGVQSNYYCINYQDNPEAVPADLRDFVSKASKFKMDMNHVARYCNDIDGLSDCIDAPIVKGETQTKTFSIDIPSNVKKPENLTLVVLLLDSDSGEILNAARIVPSITDGIAATTADRPQVSAADGLVAISRFNGHVSIYNAAGQKVADTMVNNSAVFNLEKGCYVIRTSNAEGVDTLKVTL